MNYCEQENEYADHVAELDCEKRNNPCDIRVGAYMLVNDASPDQPAKYFLSLSGAVRWAENDNDYIIYNQTEDWSIYRVGNKVL